MTRQLPPAGGPSLRPAENGPRLAAWLAAFLTLILPSVVRAQYHTNPTPRPAPVSSDAYPIPGRLVGIDLSQQSAADAERKSVGCIQCHQGSQDPHGKATVKLGCTDCHGGNAETVVKEFAHVNPRFPEAWRSTGNPVRSYTLLNHESPEFTMFVNPGDLRVAHISCGTSGCHPGEVNNNRKSMMTHGAMLWEAALYNNGAFPLKRARYGESYSMNGVPQMIVANPPPTEEETRLKGELPFLMPLPRFENSQPANILRILRTWRQSRQRGRYQSGLPAVSDPGSRPLGRPPRGPTQQSGPGDRHPNRSGLHRPAEDTSPRPDPQLLRNQRPPRRLSIERLLGVSRHVRQRPVAGPLRIVCSVRQRGDQLQPRPDHPQERAGPPNRAQVHHRPADQPVHHLPHPPRHHRHEQLPWFHVVGRGDRRRADVPQEAEESDRRAVRPGSLQQSRRGVRPGQLVRPSFPGEDGRAQPVPQAHPVCRLPRPRLGLPKRLQEGPARQPA